MSRGQTLEKRAKEVIMGQIEDMGEITTEAVMDLIRPHFQFDYQNAKEQAIRRKANRLMSQFRDENGIRTCFSAGDSKYINIDTTKDMQALNAVQKQIDEKYYGLNAAKKKINKRKRELEGQLPLFNAM